ncbi:MAG: hypothetical protein KDB03_27395, partial [Planctomycetales bacterium]|nr:hypothetical protein [Planctomycetales bacterium]
WNDCIQFVIYVLGGIAAVFVIANQIPGSWGALVEFIQQHNKLQLFEFWPSSNDAAAEVAPSLFGRWLISDTHGFWASLIGGAFLTIGTHGTDQMMVQRYLSARSQSDAAWALGLSGFVVCLQFALFLFIGVELAAFFSFHPEIELGRPDEIFAQFIVDWFPANTGLIGLLLAAILAAAMSTLSSSLNSSASALMNDIYLPRLKAQGKEPTTAKLLAVSRRLAVGFGLLQIAIGIAAQSLDRTVVASALTIAGFSSGLLLGAFSLALFVRRAQAAHVLLGMLCGLAMLLAVHFLLPYWQWRVAYQWYALIGMTITLVCGILASYAFPKSTRQNQTANEAP